MPSDAGRSALWGGVLTLYSKVVSPVGGAYQYAGLFKSLPSSIYYELLGVTVDALILGGFLSWMNFMLLGSVGVFKVIVYAALLVPFWWLPSFPF